MRIESWRGLRLQSRPVVYPFPYAPPVSPIVGAWMARLVTFFERVCTMIVFEKGLDIRTREATSPTVAKFNTGNGYRYIVIGTDYGHVHTSSGDVRTWGSYSGARRYIRYNYGGLPCYWYAVFVGTTWAKTRNKKRAIASAREKHGEVRRMIYPPRGERSWDYPTFYTCSDRIADFRK